MLLIFGYREYKGGHHGHKSRKYKIDYSDTLTIKIDSLPILSFLDTNVTDCDISNETWELDTNRLKISFSNWNKYITRIPSISIEFNDSASTTHYRRLDDMDTIERYSMYIHHKFSFDRFHLYLLYDTWFDKDNILSKHILITNINYHPLSILQLNEDILMDNFIQFDRENQLLKLTSFNFWGGDPNFRDSLIYIVDLKNIPSSLSIGFFNRRNHWED